MPICALKDCKTRASFGPPKGTARYCAKHKADTHVDLVNPKCKHAGCTVRASYGPPGKLVEWCSKHRAADHVSTTHKQCKHPGCTTRASFGKTPKTPEWCAAHQLAGHISTNKTCAYAGCSTQCRYGPSGGSAKWCATHKTTGDIDLYTKRCKYENCKTSASYGPVGKPPAWCKTHMQTNDVCTYAKLCAYTGCSTCATYGPPEGSREWCAIHKAETDIDLVSSMCGHADCKKQASYGPPDGSPIHCLDHKDKEHINLRRIVCQYDKCTRRALYGTGASPTHCAQHRIDKQEDRVHPLCKHRGCDTRANYGYLFKPKTHCAEHKTIGMYMNNRPKCECGDSYPCWTDKEENYPRRCEACKTDKDLNVVERPCINCGFEGMLREDYLDCDDCAIYREKEPNLRQEKMVKAILDEAKMEYKSHDKIPKESCHRYRPDFYFDWGTHIVILEVDEDQHRGYACECEQARMINLFQDQGGMRTLFIRFNPDNYRDKVGTLHKWTAGRGTKLLEVLQQTRDHQPEHLVSAVYLYYDAFDANQIEFIPLNYGL